MIFAICALRAVGIPARQCYTPYWPHTDDNHAWTEVWADGKWHYFGACEPEPVLDRGWFTDAAARAMLVVSTAYGDYHGAESVLKRYGGTTLINSTSVYGKTRTLTVLVQDEKGTPLPKTKVVFSLFNYGALMPALSLESDSSGAVSVTCGLGDWFVSAGKDEAYALSHAPAAHNRVTLRLGKSSALHKLTFAAYSPPPVVTASEGAKQDSLFRCRLAREDSLRASFWDTWAREANLPAPKLHPDSLWSRNAAGKLGVDPKDLCEIFEQARGNWGNLYRFLTGRYPDSDSTALYPANEVQKRFTLLQTLSDKDRRDFSTATLNEHFQFLIFGQPLRDSIVALAAMDSLSRKHFEDYVIAPRIGDEPSSPWRRKAAELIWASSQAHMADSKDDTVLVAWIKTNIKVDTTRDRLGPPLTPAQVLDMRRGSQRDLEALYIALCRVRSIPARFDPVSSALQRWEGAAWKNVNLKPPAKGKPEPSAPGKLNVAVARPDTAVTNSLYMKSWCVSAWQNDHFEPMDFNFQTPYKDISWPQDLPAGLYCLTSGQRRPDGSAPVTFQWFEIKSGQTAKATLRFKKP
jgi:hypothetical protein